MHECKTSSTKRDLEFGMVFFGTSKFHKSFLIVSWAAHIWWQGLSCSPSLRWLVELASIAWPFIPVHFFGFWRLRMRWMRWSWPSTDLWVWHWISAPTGRLFDTAPVEIPCARQLMLAFVARGTFQWPVVYQYVRSLVLRDQPGRCYVHHH